MNTILPAQPGWFVLSYFPADGDKPEWLCKTTIIAWIVQPFDDNDGAYEPIAITADGSCRPDDGHGPHDCTTAVLDPSGAVVGANCTIPSLEAWLDAQRKKAPRDHSHVHNPP